MRALTLFLVLVAAVAHAAPPDAAVVAAKDIDSAEILARTTLAASAEVRHILVGWDALSSSYRGHMDPRAQKRTNAEAAKLALEIAAKLAKDPKQIDALTTEYSEDPGSLGGTSYTVDGGSQFVPEFKNLALRLRDNEVGIVRTSFGYHVMIRIPADPLISSDILARQPETATVFVQHVLIGWDSTSRPTEKALKRTKAEADKLAIATLARVRAGAKMEKVMAEVSEDPGTKDTGKTYDVDANTAFVQPFKDLSLRLKLGEAGLVKTVFGWHIIKRVPPPPRDPLESAAILDRAQVAQAVKVKHILLGWSATHADDPRGTKRTRAELEKLVKATLARLKKGDKFEDLMDELSEDPGSAKTGVAYPVEPKSPMVKPFLEMSLRLNLDEIGVVKTDYGIHIIKRVE